MNDHPGASGPAPHEASTGVAVVERLLPQSSSYPTVRTTPSVPASSVEGATISSGRSWARRLVEHRFLGVLLAAFSLSTLVWDLLYRRGQSFDIDESGYLGFSLLDYQALGKSGLVGWIEQVESPSIHAPLTTALTTPVYLIFGPRPVAALIVPLVFTLIAITATYGLGRRVAGESVARGAAILLASAPVIINYSRDYHFAPAATAVTVTALYCLARSDGLMSRRWSAMFGVALGLMPLARTMTVAFLPGFAVTVAVILIANGERGRRLVNAVVCGVVSVAVSALWLGVNGNGRQVWEYLTGFGYGAASTHYGESHPLFSYDAWLGSLQTWSQYILLPHLLLLSAGGVALLALGARLLISGAGVRGALSRATRQKIITSPSLPLVVVTASGLVVLTSSANQGSAFVAPLIPGMCVLTVWGLRSLFGSQRWAVSTAIGVVAVVAAVPTLPFSGSLAGTWGVTVPQLGHVPVTSGQGVIQQFLQVGAAGTTSQTHRDPGLAEVGRAWLLENRETAERLQSQYGDHALVAFGFRHRHMNPNAVNVAQMAAGNDALPLVMVNRDLIEDSIDAYRSWLRAGDAATSCLLLTASGVENEFVPIVSDSLMSSAAVAEGFQPIGTWPLPDGRVVTEWQRVQSCPS